MAQKRYFEYQSLIKSKTSAEGIALAAGGIGVVHGFDKVSIDGSNKVLTISTDNTIDLTNSDGVVEPVKHVIITPDGILTTETGDIPLSLSGENPETITQGAYFVLASHQHIESVEAIIPTSFTLVKGGDISIISELTKVDGTVNIRNWYTKLREVYPEYNANTTIIGALIEFNSSSDIKVYNPWYNKWPSDRDFLLGYLEDIVGILAYKNKITQMGKYVYNIYFTDITTEFCYKLLSYTLLKYRADITIHIPIRMTFENFHSGRTYYITISIRLMDFLQTSGGDAYFNYTIFPDSYHEYSVYANEPDTPMSTSESCNILVKVSSGSIGSILIVSDKIIKSLAIIGNAFLNIKLIPSNLWKYPEDMELLFNT